MTGESLGRLARTPLRVAAQTLSPGGPRGRIAILAYHRVLSGPDPMLPGVTTADEFRWQVDALRSVFTVLPLSEAAERLDRGDLPARAACITFDDGYANNASHAMPILQSLGVSATFFVATGYLDGGRMFNDSIIELVRRWPRDAIDTRRLGIGELAVGNEAERLHAVEVMLPRLKYLPTEERIDCVSELLSDADVQLPDDLMMTSDQVRQLSEGGMEIGAHTVRHPILTTIEPDDARAEIADSKRTLEDLIQKEVRVFAYPNGTPARDYAREHVDIVRNLGFTSAVSSAWGVAHRGNDRFQLPRLTPWDNSPFKFMKRLLQNHLRRTVEEV